MNVVGGFGKVAVEGVGFVLGVGGGLSKKMVFLNQLRTGRRLKFAVGACVCGLKSDESVSLGA